MPPRPRPDCGVGEKHKPGRSWDGCVAGGVPSLKLCCPGSATVLRDGAWRPILASQTLKTSQPESQGDWD